MQVETLGRRRNVLLINDGPAKRWGPTTWSPHDNDEELAEWQDWLDEIGASAERDWLGHLTAEGDLRTTRGDIRRGARHAEWCIKNGLYYQASLIQATAIELPRLTRGHKRHISKCLDELGHLDGRICLEVANEASQASYSADGVKYLRDEGWKGLIAVTTGKGGPVQQLEDAGADIIAVTPSYDPDGRHVLEMDDDHTGPGKNTIPHYERWKDEASIFFIMLAWDDPDLPGIESHIPGEQWANKAWNNPGGGGGGGGGKGKGGGGGRRERQRR
jgi:hypothetical protein